MVKLVAIYRMPEDVEAFNKHYEEVHSPLAASMPGLLKLEVGRVYGTPMGESDLHLIAEMYFENQEALNNGLSSPEGRAAGKDLRGFAGKLVSMYFVEVV
ncbi:EthD family reductase [Paenibacillus sp. KN14-4R]|uniref:EthD family reductase n=1 Tax=Paenibacillus sp. KN14-4R TaxID=3445773 RepID=UPI003F9F4D17